MTEDPYARGVTGWGEQGPPAPPSSGFTAGRIVALVAAVLVCLPLALGVWILLTSTVLAAPGADQHGYGLIFGTLLTAVCVLLLLPVVPWIFAGRARRIAGFVCGAIAVAFVLLVVGVVLYGQLTDP
ncbi:hypothetical protein EXU48_09325 [Occultella glacieicola]|uniref:DUF4190 domain-containing protein n=1 Tax=Occultella glacieicola TaxID=2518684 RepID=A0ABY2E4K7_9MICO|nr:hypothetical protein [Occultella glacieicola]TDE94969.1 hypothetical protein EXU48_09325 [Occultella glacieicola]